MCSGVRDYSANTYVHPVPGTADAEAAHQYWKSQPPLMQHNTLLNAQLQSQLQYQMANQQLLNQSSDLFSPAPPITGLPLGSSFNSQDLANGPHGPQQESVPSWPPLQSGSVNQCLPAQPPVSSAWQVSGQDSGRINSLRLNDASLQLYLSSTAPYNHLRNPQANPQILALERLRREMLSIQNELDRAEREVLRQKSLRETERLEFTEAKDRLKHSWANDREDFARVKSILKMKNAEHHAQSGRLSQQLKDCEACNKALRDLVARHGVPIPIELESTQVKRIAAHAFRQDTSLVEGVKAEKLVPELDRKPCAVHGRGSLDSYFGGKAEDSSDMKCHSLPDLRDPPVL